MQEMWFPRVRVDYVVDFKQIMSIIRNKFTKSHKNPNSNSGNQNFKRVISFYEY